MLISRGTNVNQQRNNVDRNLSIVPKIASYQPVKYWVFSSHNSVLISQHMFGEKETVQDESPL